MDETSVTLALYGEDLDPDEITRLLKCDPTDAHRRGDRWSPRAAPRSRGAWFLSVRGRSPRSPAELTDVILSRVPDDGGVWEDLSRRFEIQLRYGLFQYAWNRGFELPASIIGRAARLGASLQFDIYADVDEEDEGT